MISLTFQIEPVAGDPIVIPIKSYSATLQRSGRTCSVQIPTLNYAEQIADNLVAEMVFLLNGIEILRIPISGPADYDRGPESQNMTLMGEGAADIKTNTLEISEAEVTYESNRSQEFQLRIHGINPAIGAGTTLDYNGDLITLERVVQNFGEGLFRMDCTEGD